MTLYRVGIATCCLVVLLSVATAQTVVTNGDCIANNPKGWPLPWLNMKHSASGRSILLYNGKSTDLHKEALKFRKDVSITVPACGRKQLLRTNHIVRIDYGGKVFAFIVAGEAVTETAGKEASTGAIMTAMWYDENGDGEFEQVMWTPVLPPTPPAWVHDQHSHLK